MMQNEQNEQATEQTPDPAPPPPVEKESTPPAPAPEPAQSAADAPPASQTVLNGKETEETADLKRRLAAKEKEIADRETKLAERELRLQRKAEASRAPEKRAWLGGNSLID